LNSRKTKTGGFGQAQSQPAFGASSPFGGGGFGQQQQQQVRVPCKKRFCRTSSVSHKFII
jgi:hypothetical protein